MIKVREVGIAKEVMAGDVSPVAMFFSESLSKPLTKAWKNRQHFVRAIIMGEIKPQFKHILHEETVHPV